MTDQTTADAAERVQAVLDAHTAAARPSAHVLYAIPDPNRPRGWLHLMEPDLRALLADRKRMAAELEQVRRAVAEATGLLHRLAAPNSCSLDNEGACWVHDGYWPPCPHPRGRRFVEAWRTVQAEATTPAAELTPGKRTPEQWCAEYGIDIADPDGWRGRNDPPWDEPITLPDFLRRAAVSTTRGLTPDLWNRLSREAHEAADAERSDAEGAGKGPESHSEASGRDACPPA